VTFINAYIVTSSYHRRKPVKAVTTLYEKTLELNGAHFEVAFEDGRDMLRMIARSRKWLEEEFPLRDR